jgi:hypothetical protein
VAILQTARIGIPYPDDDEPNDPPSHLQQLASTIDPVMALDYQGPLSARGPAATVGRYYTDSAPTGLTYRDNGVAWIGLARDDQVVHRTGGDVISTSPNNYGLRIVGAPGQASNLLELRDSSLGYLAGIDYSGAVVLANNNGTATLRGGELHLTTNATAGLVAMDSARDLRFIQNSLHKMTMVAGGGLVVGGSIGSFVGPGASATPLAVVGAPAQLADLVQVRDSAQALLASISNLGVLTAAGGVRSAPMTPTRYYDSANVYTNTTSWTRGWTDSTKTTAAPTSGTTFIAPPSGEARVDVAGWLNAGGDNRGQLGYEIRSGAVVGSGTVFFSPDDNTAAMQKAATSTVVTNGTEISGLTPGATYNIRFMVRETDNNANAGTTYIWRRLIVTPVM